MSLPQLVKGDYILRVQVSDYSNPRSTCVECRDNEDDPLGCCDNNSETECSISQRCDNEFFYCLLPRAGATLTLDTIMESRTINDATDRGEALGCLQPSTALRSGRNLNDAPIDFLSETVLDLPNPLEFQIEAEEWEVSHLKLESEEFSSLAKGYMATRRQTFRGGSTGGGAASSSPPPT